MSVGGYLGAGNLKLTEPTLDYELFTAYSHTGSNGWRLGVARFSPRIEADSLIRKLQITEIWVEQSANVNLRGLTFRIGAGLALCYIELDYGEDEVTAGSVGFRATAALRKDVSDRISVEPGLVFRGTSITDTGRFTDRLGLSVSISWRI